MLRPVSLVLVGAVVGVLAACSAPAPEPADPLTISGIIRTADGEPCPCPLGISSPDYAMPELAQIAGEDGSYAWAVPGPGTFTVEAADATRRGSVTVEVVDADVVADVTVVPR